MTHIVDIVPDADILLALTPEELGLAMLPFVQAHCRDRQGAEVGSLVRIALGNQGTIHYPGADQTEISDALREAWAWLEGAALLIQSQAQVGMNPFRVLSRRARQLVKDGDPRQVLAGRRLPKDALHPIIRDEVWGLFQRQKYATAVFEAMKAVEVAVREASGLGNDLVGVALMSEAFKVGGPLADGDAERGEQVARMNLFQGAIGSFKNPHSHRNVELTDASEVIEVLMLASHLLRIVADRRMFT